MTGGELTVELQVLRKAILDTHEIRCVELDDIIHFGDTVDYASNFGYQWQKFATTQLDSQTGLNLTRDRLMKESEWNLNDLKGSTILELGSGAGRFTEVLAKTGANIVTVDMSSAIYANKMHNNRNNVLFLRGAIEDLLCLDIKFDFVLCYGVVQHTRQPSETYHNCVTLLKEGGQLSIDHYIRKWWPNRFYHPKYIWRPITKRMPPDLLLKLIKRYMRFYLPFDILLAKIKPFILSDFIRGILPFPCWNYYRAPGINQDYESLFEWAVLDTFDALGAKYDYPASPREVENIARKLDLRSYRVKKGGNGVVLNGVR
jgi:SAM-dependent methyltransferase